MNRFERYANLTAVILPFVAFAAAIVLLWNRAVGPTELAILAVFYLAGGFGVTIGFHRLLTHRSFQTHKWVEYLLAVFGSMTLQGPVISWVADHRKHHAHTDQEGDPHSPHTGHGGGLRGALHGLWYAHVGWLWHTQGQASRRRYARDLMEDRGMRAIQRAFPLLVLASFALPFAAGYALTGTLAGALAGLLWGGLVRIFLLHHVTWSINSVCHFFGRRRFEVDDESTNVFWLALPSLGEAWHHNHHAFPRSAKHGLRWWEVDVSAGVIALMERLGLAWQVTRIDSERQRSRLAGAAPARPKAPRFEEPAAGRT
jgi:stearoyl-CoA desaturase (delta-9 desaturase)